VTGETDERVRIPGKPAALKHVASYMAARMSPEDLFGSTGLSYHHDRLTSAEIRRLEWAIGEVQRRLRKIAGAEEPAE
jgi:hypothetical protein